MGRKVTPTAKGISAIGLEDGDHFFAPAPDGKLVKIEMPNEEAVTGPGGQRGRSRTRFLKDGTDAMPDYELLELTLFAAVPRKDVKLLARFGSFAEVIAAREPAGNQGRGRGSGQSAQDRGGRRQAHGSEQRDRAALLDYCTAAMTREAAEEFRALFLDRKNILIADEVQTRGTIDHTPVYPREIVKRALAHGASAIILVHNHPSGDPTPSRADIEMTRDIQAAAKALAIAVHDHLVIGRAGHASFKSRGML